MDRKETLSGTIRIGVKDLHAYEKTAKLWKKSKLKFPEICSIVRMFKAHGNFEVLIDKKNPEFLKGQLSSEGQPLGARINQLPNGKVLDKAFSLFAKHLNVHDQDSEDHWDVLYQNKGGTYSYCYVLEKKLKHRELKYHKVHEFDKHYQKLFDNVTKALGDKNDHLAVPMYTLLKTHMRVGNEIYYKTHGHKGLTTLKKEDVNINKKVVTFNYLGKDGVPILIKHEFPDSYIKRLKEHLKTCKKGDFIFTSCRTGHPLAEKEFKKGFVKYCGKEFYPHIVRSHYATSKVKEFLKGKRKLNDDEVKRLYLSIASELGHKKFIKKENRWQENYSVTVSHYIQPELVEKVKSMMV